MAFSKSKALLFPTPNPIFEKAMFFVRKEIGFGGILCLVEAISGKIKDKMENTTYG